MRLSVTPSQAAALGTYVFESVHDDAPFPGFLDGKVLTINPGHEREAWRILQDASNSADDSKDARWRDALCLLAVQVRW